VAAVKVLDDVTTQNEAEAALGESEERLRTVVEGTPVVLFSLDRGGVYKLAEGRGLEALGLEPDEVAGRSIFELFADEPEVVATALRALAGETVAENVRIRGRIFETWYSPMRDEGGATSGVIGVATDVTERKLAEEALDRSRVAELAALAEVDEAQKLLAFYAGAREERKMISRELHDRVAHSMAVVRQCLELYEAFRDRDPPAAAAKLEQAKEEAKSALGATRDLSMMLRRSEAEGGLEKALSDLLETTIPADVRYKVSVEGDESLVPPHVGNQLFLILREAIRNAVTHSGCERVTVGLVVAPEGVAGTVEDDGLGFGNGNGEIGGVGMRAMKERAALLGGALSVSSTPDAGTKVEVSVPITEEDAR
jgi:PAS domain S-box-containing protein